MNDNSEMEQPAASPTARVSSQSPPLPGWKRSLLTGALLTIPAPVLAQDEVVSGDAGYRFFDIIVVLGMIALALFAVCKSSRRS